jgi:hypothetical protein
MLLARSTNVTWISIGGPEYSVQCEDSGIGVAAGIGMGSYWRNAAGTTQTSPVLLGERFQEGKFLKRAVGRNITGTGFEGSRDWVPFRAEYSPAGDDNFLIGKEATNNGHESESAVCVR